MLKSKSDSWQSAGKVVVGRGPRFVEVVQEGRGDVMLGDFTGPSPIYFSFSFLFCGLFGKEQYLDRVGNGGMDIVEGAFSNELGK